MPRTSLTTLEVGKRRVKSDARLEKYPEIRANALTFLRGLQRQQLSEDEMTIAVGLAFIRIDLLLSTDLGTAEGINLRVRLLEQVHKATNALRRRRRGIPSGGGSPKVRPPSRPFVFNPAPPEE